MAKDRFSNQKRSNYDKEFRYGNNNYIKKVKCNIVLTPNKKKSIKQILDNPKLFLNSWDKEFLLNLENKALISEKQKYHLDLIFDKLKSKVKLFLRG